MCEYQENIEAGAAVVDWSPGRVVRLKQSGDTYTVVDNDYVYNHTSGQRIYVGDIPDWGSQVAEAYIQLA
jgi:hypothetical protein